MPLAWKEDWEPARRRLLAWWEREAMDRPVIQIYASKTAADLKALAEMPKWWPGPGPERDLDTGKPLRIEERWLKADHLVRSRFSRFEQIYWAGEAFPYFFVNQGPVSIPAYLGCPWTYDEVTGWGKPMIEDYDTFHYPEFDPENPYWKATVAVTRAAAKAFAGKALVSVSDLGSGGDELVTLRGNSNLIYDLADRPEVVKEKLAWVQGFLKRYYDLLYEILYPAQGATVTWLASYYEGRSVTLQCDFSCMISPVMFQEFFLPVIQYQAAQFDRVCYHLDGPGAVRHLDALLAVPEIHAIQWVPGAGAPPMTEWLPLLKRIQAGKKALHIACLPHELERLVRELEPRGLCIMTFALGREMADQMLANAKNWAAKKY